MGQLGSLDFINFLWAISVIAIHNIHIWTGTEIHKNFIKSKLPSRSKICPNLKVCFIKIAHRVTYNINDVGQSSVMKCWYDFSTRTKNFLMAG